MEELKQFSLLMWKHYHLRKHRWFITSIELLLPIFIAFLLCAEGGRYLGHNPTHHNVTIEPVQKAVEFMKRTANRSLVYTPENDFTREIINRVNENLGWCFI